MLVGEPAQALTPEERGVAGCHQHGAGRRADGLEGDPIDFYHGAEKGFRREQFLGDKLIFLERNYVEQEKRWVWAVLENSTLTYNTDRAQKLRIIRQSQRKRRTR